MNHLEWFKNRKQSLPNILLSIDKSSEEELKTRYTESLAIVNRMLENYNAFKRDDASDAVILFNLVIIGKIVHKLNSEIEGGKSAL